MAWKRFIFATDSHGDMVDRDAERRLIKFVEEWRPHLRIHGGDALDLRCWRKGAGAEEQLERVSEDVACFQRLFESYRPHVWLRGNHDERLWEFSQSIAHPDRAQLCQMLAAKIEDEMLPRLGCKTVLPYDSRAGVYEWHGLKFLHGYKAGMYSAKAHALSYGSCIFGHCHTYQQHTLEHWRDVRAIAAPALAQLDMPYLARTVAKLRHRQGWLFGVVHTRTGAWEAWPVLYEDRTRSWLDPTKLQS